MLANFVHVMLSITGSLSTTLLGWLGDADEFNSKDVIDIQIRAVFAALISYSIFYSAQTLSGYTFVVAFMVGMIVDAVSQGILVLIRYLRSVGLL